MEQQFLSLFESAKKSADAVTTSTSTSPEVCRCLDALDQLKRFPVTSSRVLLSTPVAKGVQYLTKHRSEPIRTAASCLLDTWRRKLYARNPAVDGKIQTAKSGNGSKTETLIVKIHGRVIGRIKVNMPIKTEENLKIEEKKIKQEKENGFACFKKPPQEPAMRFAKPGEVKGIGRCFKKPPEASAKRNTTQEKVRDSCRGFKKPSAKCITQQENVKDSCSFIKKPSEEPVKCSDALRRKVRHILVESMSRVAKEVKKDLREAVSSREPICVAAEVESDPKNPDLRRKVLLGQIKAEKLVTITSEEMASNQRRFENAQIRKKSLCKKMKNGQEEDKSSIPTEY
ncbi:unnamed protein product [Dovyalis caffra]|uniref:TFIIS N-terminal domain-containing protein n=1 Tax=Dovyalis caffra TaxID=77055 RepID=A0AAV1RXF7_9ROSI|nr:unnamed protein product [Dovyalis caffra]